MSCRVQHTYTSHATHVPVVEWVNFCTGIFGQFVEGLSQVLALLLCYLKSMAATLKADTHSSMQ